MTDKYREGQATYMLNYWRERPNEYLWWSAKKRAAKSGIEFTITKEDIVIPEYCPVLKVKLSMIRSGNKTYAPSLDRKNNQLGYTPNNIAVISWKANKYKSDMTLDIMRGLYEYVSS